MSNNQIIIDGIKGGKSKGAILTDLIRADADLDLVQAGALYLEVGTKEKLLLSKDDKDTLTLDIGNEFTVVTKDGKKDVKTLNRTDAVKKLAASGSMSESAAAGRLKQFCKDEKIDFPNATRQKRDMTAVDTAFKKWFEDKTERASIEAGLVQHFGYGEKGVAAAYMQIGKRLGLIEGGSGDGRRKLAAWFANPANVTNEDGTAKAKKVIVDALIAESGAAQATADTRYAMWLFAADYHAAMTNPAVEEKAA